MLIAAFPLRRLVFALLVVAPVVSSCAATTRQQPPPAGRRIKDSPPEAAAAQRAAAPRSLELQAEEERWGIEAARERKRAREREDAAKARPGAPVGTTDVVEPGRTP